MDHWTGLAAEIVRAVELGQLKQVIVQLSPITHPQNHTTQHIAHNSFHSINCPTQYRLFPNQG